MIQSYYDALVGRMDRVRPFNSSSHVFGPTMEMVEQELLMDPLFEKKVPADYARDRGSEAGLRRLRMPLNAWYKEMRVRMGITTLHIRERSRDACLESVAMLRMNDAEVTDFEPVRAFSASDMSAVFVHENGIVSAEYIHGASPFAIVNSYYASPPRGALKYPRGEEEIEGQLRPLFSRALLPYNKTAQALPMLVMLGVRVCRG